MIAFPAANPIMEIQGRHSCVHGTIAGGEDGVPKIKFRGFPSSKKFRGEEKLSAEERQRRRPTIQIHVPRVAILSRERDTTEDAVTGSWYLASMCDKAESREREREKCMQIIISRSQWVYIEAYKWDIRALCTRQKALEPLFVRWLRWGILSWTENPSCSYSCVVQGPEMGSIKRGNREAFIKGIKSQIDGAAGVAQHDWKKTMKEIKLILMKFYLVLIYPSSPWKFQNVINIFSQVIRLVRVTKVLRVFKLVRHFAGLQSLFFTIRQVNNTDIWFKSLTLII